MRKEISFLHTSVNKGMWRKEILVLRKRSQQVKQGKSIKLFILLVHNNWNAPLEKNSTHCVAWLLLSSSHTYNLSWHWISLFWPSWQFRWKKRDFSDSRDHIKNFLTSNSNEDIGTRWLVHSHLQIIYLCRQNSCKLYHID